MEGSGRGLLQVTIGAFVLHISISACYDVPVQRFHPYEYHYD